MKIAKFLVVVGTLAATGCDSKSGHGRAVEYHSQIEELAVQQEPPDPLVESQACGRVIYMHYCQICHGDEGRGDGFNSGNLAVTPRDFSVPAFWKTATQENLLSAITAGGTAVGKSVLMPAWGKTLSPGQIDNVVAFLRTVPALVEKRALAERELAEQEENEEEEEEKSDQQNEH